MAKSPLSREQARMIAEYAAQGLDYYLPDDYDCNCGICGYCSSGTLSIPTEQLAQAFLAEMDAHDATKARLAKLEDDLLLIAATDLSEYENQICDKVCDAILSAMARPEPSFAYPRLNMLIEVMKAHLPYMPPQGEK